MLSGKQAAEEFGTSFSEVSALAGIGVDEVSEVSVLIINVNLYYNHTYTKTHTEFLITKYCNYNISAVTA